MIPMAIANAGSHRSRSSIGHARSTGGRPGKAMRGLRRLFERLGGFSPAGSGLTSRSRGRCSMRRVSVAPAECILIVPRGFAMTPYPLALLNCRGRTVVSIYDFLDHGPGWEVSSNGSFPGLLVAERVSFVCAKEHTATRCIPEGLSALAQKQPSLDWFRSQGRSSGGGRTA